MNLPKTSRIIKAITVSAIFAAGIANAGLMQTVTAKLQTPLSAPMNDVIAAEVAWQCEGDTCLSQIDRRTPMARDCRQLARQVGPIASFTVGALELAEADLAKCNQGIAAK